jgi:hypothetical protein
MKICRSCEVLTSLFWWFRKKSILTYGSSPD